MDEQQLTSEHKLNKHFVFLTKYMQVTHLLLGYLLEASVINRWDYEEINQHPSGHDRNEALVSFLGKRPEGDYLIFVWALIQTNQGNVAAKITDGDASQWRFNPEFPKRSPDLFLDESNDEAKIHTMDIRSQSGDTRAMARILEQASRPVVFSYSLIHDEEQLTVVNECKTNERKENYSQTFRQHSFDEEPLIFMNECKTNESIGNHRQTFWQHSSDNTVRSTSDTRDYRKPIRSASALQQSCMRPMVFCYSLFDDEPVVLLNQTMDDPIQPNGLMASHQEHSSIPIEYQCVKLKEDRIKYAIRTALVCVTIVILIAIAATVLINMLVKQRQSQRAMSRHYSNLTSSTTLSTVLSKTLLTNAKSSPTASYGTSKPTSGRKTTTSLRSLGPTVNVGATATPAQSLDTKSFFSDDKLSISTTNVAPKRNSSIYGTQLVNNSSHSFGVINVTITGQLICPHNAMSVDKVRIWLCDNSLRKRRGKSVGAASKGNFLATTSADRNGFFSLPFQSTNASIMDSYLRIEHYCNARDSIFGERRHRHSLSDHVWLNQNELNVGVINLENVTSSLMLRYSQC